ncbi:MAG TPA: hypothetical protein VFM18_08750 [Methanosarcina sp.]|nr:hypothetical protein [Methanosarcina sp.]
MAFDFSFRFGSGLFSRPATGAAVDLSGAVSTAIRVQVYPRWYHYVAVQWTVPDSWGDCVFNVYHSALEEGPYELLTTSPLNGNCLVDYSSQDYSKFRNGFYVVEAILRSLNNRVLRSKPCTWQNVRRNWVQLRALDIQRRENVLLSKFTGVKSYLFKRRTYGMRCTNCWDPVSETVTKDKCLVCFGTSFQGGYFPPVPLFVQYEPTPNNLMKTYFGKFEPNQIGAWSIAIPEIASDDIVVRIGDWNVYKVGPIQTTELQAVPVRQIMQLTQLGRRDVENELVTQKLTEFPTELATKPLLGTLPGA